MTDFEEYTKIIKNMPVTCAYCDKKHDKDKIQYIHILGSKREHVCNKECAIGLAKTWINQWQDNIKLLNQRIKELEKE